MANGLLSNDGKTIAADLKEAIEKDRGSRIKKKARQGVDYYQGEHQILENRIFYINDEGLLVEDLYATNVKIPHQFLTEIIDQKVQYLLSNPIEVNSVSDDEQFEEYLEEYYNEDFNLFLQEMLEGSSQKGHEYAFARTTSDDKLRFQVADSLGVFMIYNENNDVVRLIRYYDEVIEKDDKEVETHRAEVWDDSRVWFFVSEDNQDYKLDPDVSLNPRPHVVATNAEGKLAGRSYGTLPFFKLDNNKFCKTDLEPIKALIDDYDLMDAFLSNNLQDFTEAIYVVKGFMGDDLSRLRQNIKAKKTVATGESGGVEIQTVDIPVEGRKTKMEIDRENIYKFGMALDVAKVGDGNITNIVLKSRYALLDMKANKTETRLRVLLEWANDMIVNDINRRYGTAYKPKDVEFEIERRTMVNETDLRNNEKTEAQAKQLMIESILAAAPKLDDQSVLQLICEQFDLDWQEVQALLQGQDFTTGLTDDDDGDGDNDEGNEQIDPDDDDNVDPDYNSPNQEIREVLSDGKQ